MVFFFIQKEGLDKLIFPFKCHTFRFIILLDTVDIYVMMKI